MLRLRQGSAIFNIGGSMFTSGTSYGPLGIVLNLKDSFNITVAVLGTNTQQVGFVIRTESGSIVF